MTLVWKTCFLLFWNSSSSCFQNVYPGIWQGCHLPWTPLIHSSLYVTHVQRSPVLHFFGVSCEVAGQNQDSLQRPHWGFYTAVLREQHFYGDKVDKNVWTNRLTKPIEIFKFYISIWSKIVSSLRKWPLVPMKSYLPCLCCTYAWLSMQLRHTFPN